MADRALLNTCIRFAKVSGDGFEGLRLEGLRGRPNALEVMPAIVPQLELLRDETPPPQAVRVAGTLDTISASRSDTLLKLKDGTKVPARMGAKDLNELSGVSVFFGSWPGDESEAQLLEALKAIG